MIDSPYPKTICFRVKCTLFCINCELTLQPQVPMVFTINDLFTTRIWVKFSDKMWLSAYCANRGYALDVTAFGVTAVTGKSSFSDIHSHRSIHLDFRFIHSSNSDQHLGPCRLWILGSITEDLRFVPALKALYLFCVYDQQKRERARFKLLCSKLIPNFRLLIHF